MLIYLALLVAYIFVRDIRWRATISGIFTVLTLLSLIAAPGIFALVIFLLWSYLFFRDLQFAGFLRR